MTEPWVWGMIDVALVSKDEATCICMLAVRNSEYTGGKLMFVDGARLICPERKPGCATAHNQTAIHGVSSITAGVRYNLLAAFDSAE